MEVDNDLINPINDARSLDDRDLITINVGGKLFTTRRQMLKKIPYFDAFLERWYVDTSIPFIDRDPTGFENVLGLLRDANYPFDRKWEYELRFYGISQYYNDYNNMNEYNDLPANSNVTRHSISGHVTGKFIKIQLHDNTIIDRMTFGLPLHSLTASPILASTAGMTFSKIHIILGFSYLDTYAYNVVVLYNNIYYATRQPDINCIRLPIIHHTLGEFARDKHKSLDMMRIDLEGVANDVPLPKLFYDYSNTPDNKEYAFDFISHVAITHPATKEVYIQHQVYNRIKEIWLRLPAPLINIIIYADDIEICSTHSVAIERAAERGIYPAENHYIIDGLPDTKIINLQMHITTHLVENKTIDIVLCLLNNLEYKHCYWS